jgi:hypothetical protein
LGTNVVRNKLFSVWNIFVGASSSDSDVDYYVSARKLLTVHK